MDGEKGIAFRRRLLSRFQNSLDELVPKRRADTVITWLTYLNLMKLSIYNTRMNNEMIGALQLLVCVNSTPVYCYRKGRYFLGRVEASSDENI